MLPDAELVGLTVLEHLAPTVTVLPPNFDPPMIQVQRVGGDMDLTSYTDLPQLQISFYGTTRGAAWDLANQGQMDLIKAACTEVAGVLVENVEIMAGGILAPDLDPDDRRVIVQVQMYLDLRPYFT